MTCSRFSPAQAFLPDRFMQRARRPSRKGGGASPRLLPAKKPEFSRSFLDLGRFCAILYENGSEVKPVDVQYNKAWGSPPGSLYLPIAFPQTAGARSAACAGSGRCASARPAISGQGRRALCPGGGAAEPEKEALP